MQDVIAADRVTGLAVIRAGVGSAPAGIPPWMPPSLDNPRYLMATVGTSTGVSLRPVLVGSLQEVRSPAWPGPIWAVPEGTDLAASAFVFTTSGEIAGLVVREPDGLAIVPWDIVVAEASRILDLERTSAVDLRVEVRPLTPALTRATGATQGVVVAWVDSRGPVAKRLAVGDVIESLNAQPILHTRDWEVASSRLPAGDATLRVRRRGKSMDLAVTLPVADLSATAPATALGLTMRTVRGVGHDNPASRASFSRQSRTTARGGYHHARRKHHGAHGCADWRGLPIRSDGRGDHARDHEGQDAPRRRAGEVMPESLHSGRHRVRTPDR